MEDHRENVGSSHSSIYSYDPSHLPDDSPGTHRTRDSCSNEGGSQWRDNTAEVKAPAARKAGTKVPTARAKPISVPVDNDREPIKAFLRLRPHINADGPTAAPYLETLTDTSVQMSDPNRDGVLTENNRPRFRLSTAAPTSIYTFSHVFAASTLQAEFFTKTTLPLVRGLLDGESGLLFAYGVTNSGKTFTMQGGSTEGSAGILPRTLDVIFNSVDGLQSKSRYRPVRLHGIELGDGPGIYTRGPSLDNLSSEEPVLAQVLAEHLETSDASTTDIDPTVLSVDRNHEYSIWLSYAEVYNEKIYDLLADVSETDKPTAAQGLLLTRKALPIRPSPPSDSPDGLTGKYVSGLKQVKVESAAEAKNLVKLGQLHRRVFGTLANSQSSRSHGMVTIKLLKKHRGERDEPLAYHTARLTLVDLAGSERTKHTQTTGDRLKEAGNINKSLMVLGQCMEVMRSNQRRVAQSLAGPKHERSDTRDVKKFLAVVPFRHSKLTEILMDYFVGDGRVVMIVNVNPYDTGFDENSHVMKFAALAKEVHTLAPVPRAPPSPTKMSHNAPSGIPVPQRARMGSIAPVPHSRKVTISTGGQGGRKFSQTQVEVVEEDEDEDQSEDEDDDEPLNPLVEALFDELENMRLQLFDAEMRCAIIEADTREEVMQEMEHRIHNMEKMFARRLMNEVEQNEMKMDAKIDMLHRSGLFGKTPGKARRVVEDLEEEEDIEMGIIAEDSEDESLYPQSSTDMQSSRSNTASPLAGKGKHIKNKKQPHRASEIRMRVPSGPEHSFLPSEDDTATETDSRRDSDEDDDDGDDDGDDDEDEDEEDEDEDDETEMEEFENSETSDAEWQPDSGNESKAKGSAVLAGPSSTSTGSFIAKSEADFFTVPPSPVFANDAKTQSMRAKQGLTQRSSGKMSALAEDLEKMALSENAEAPSSATSKGKRRSTRGTAGSRSSRAKPSLEAPEEWDEAGADDSTVIVPTKQSQASKKKRQLGSKPVVTEDQIEQAVGRISQSDSGKSIRRMARGSK
ncbi:kinesin-domain-containing protein [Dentipellis sp. KUC8613]|nr:kinesin-domain-containing protein [Dentipellis sp. KUC8613]